MKILLADDHLLFSEGFALILKKLFQNSVVVLADSWSAAKQSTQQMNFDLVILDLFMPTPTNWRQELAEFMEQQHITPPVCIVSSSKDRNNILQAFELGAKGYIHKSSNLEDIKQAFNRIITGKIYFPPQVKHCFQPERHLDSNLTTRQREVLNMLAEGNNNQQIATSLNIMESTVKRHVYNICQRLCAKNRTEAVHFARQQGLLHN